MENDDLRHEEQLLANHQGHEGCPLAEPAYYDALAESIKRNLEWNRTDFAEILFSHIVSTHSLENFYSDEKEPILQDISARIVERLSASNHLSSESDLHLLIWCAIHSHLDADAFGQIINSQTVKVRLANCVLSTHLLPLAAGMLNDQAVELLLRIGADPRAGDVMFKTLSNIPYVDKRSRAANPLKQRLTKTVRHLLEHGVKLSSSKNDRNNPPIFALIPLAAHGLVDTVDVILQSAKVSDLNFHPEASSFNGYQARTVLTLALVAFKQRFFVNAIPERFLLSMQQRPSRNGPLAIMKHVILPSLKAGAVLPCDPLNFKNARNEDWFNYYRLLTLLPDYAPSVSEFNDIWVVYYFSLILEARMTSSLNVAAFRKFVETNRNRFRERELHFASFVLEAGTFPRSLQSQCRTKILRDYLPAGLNQRMAAIKSLHLPGCIADYLAFAEFDLPLRKLEILE